MKKSRQLIYALITVMIAVPCFVFYCLSIENGGILNVDVKFALMLIPIEFVLAYLSEIFIGGPIATKIALNAVNPKENKPFMVEIAIICATVCIMCPLMSFLATILYKGIMPGLIFNDATFTLVNFFKLSSNFLQTVVLNFPFALLSQLFFIQPLVRRMFGFIYKTN